MFLVEVMLTASVSLKMTTYAVINAVFVMEVNMTTILMICVVAGMARLGWSGDISSILQGSV